jgi:hypothetical protein
MKVKCDPYRCPPQHVREDDVFMSSQVFYLERDEIICIIQEETI